MTGEERDEHAALLLAREWRDTRSGIEVTLWCLTESGAPLEARFRRQRAVAFVPRTVETKAGHREPSALLSPEGAAVDAIYFGSQRALLDERDRLRGLGQPVFESDVKPSDRFLMERFVTSGLTLRGPSQMRGGLLRMVDPQIRSSEPPPVALRALSLDIETDGWDGPIISIALAAEGVDRVFLVRPDRAPEVKGAIRFCASEREAIELAFEFLRSFDPDAIIGWSVTEFDLFTLGERCKALGIPYAIGRAGLAGRVLPGSTAQQVSIARIPGRVVLDGVAMLKNATWSFERFSLDYVARALVGRGKKIASGVDPLAEIRRMHAEDPEALAAYNLEDARLVVDVFAAADLLGFALSRGRLTGLPLDRQGGSVAAFDHLYLPRLHRKGRVAPDVGTAFDLAPSPGGHVLDSTSGLFRNVLAFDFRSLYPSIIRTFAIDPYGMWDPGEDPIEGFEGATFRREGSILPEIVGSLSEERLVAQRASNEPLGRAIKILMNSFYGVLGTPACRFADARLASSITRRGHTIIEGTRRFFEERGYAVVYGDTDSLFVRVSADLDRDACRALGSELAREVNAFWRDELAKLRIDSRLELRFESHYLRFLMPTTRNEGRGSKKRYAGAVIGKSGELELVIRGLEAVRTDWTPLAREMQRELLRRVFTDEPYEEWLRVMRSDLLVGKLDAKLVYRKRLRRDIGEYESAAPHVRAAKLDRAARRDEEGDDDGPRMTEVEYVVTTRGPEPLHHRTASIDYAHYVAKQLAPAADVVLPLLGTRYDRVAGAQLSLFG